MNEEHIVEIWSLFKEYIDKKQVDLLSEKFIDLFADYGTDDETFKSCLGHDLDLDSAIRYYLDDDDSDDDYWSE